MINYPEKAYKNLENIISEKITSLTDKLSNDLNELKSFVRQCVFVEETNPQQRLLSKSIRSLRLDSRTYNCLKKRKINTIQKVITHSEQDLLNIPHLGKKCIDNIKISLKEVGLYLK